MWLFTICIMREGSKSNLYFVQLKYKQEHPFGYQFTQSCYYCNVYINHSFDKLRMAVDGIHGEKVYIDWAGNQPELLIDSITGEIKQVHFFVTAVSVSNLVYAEAFADEKPLRFCEGTTFLVLLLFFSRGFSYFQQVFKF